MAKDKVKNVGGRPSIFTDELAIKICERFASGETLSQITDCKDMPTWVTVWDWLNPNSPRFKETFSNNFQCARELAGHKHNELAHESVRNYLVNMKVDNDGRGDNAWVKLACKLADSHARLAGNYNKRYNDKLIALQAKQDAESKQTDADIEI